MVMQPADLDTLIAAARQSGLDYRGGFHPHSADEVPPFADGAQAGTVVLLGFIGGAPWRRFAASAEFGDGSAAPLDRWSRRVIEGLAAEMEGIGLYPWSGPPWLPFQRWAQRAEDVHPSPLKILIHPDYGLWHAYRGALALRGRLALPVRSAASSPCTSCSGQPCRTTCPVGAVTRDRFDAEACRRHVISPQGIACREQGCRARLACPVGAPQRYSAAQNAFHMAAFIDPRSILE